jgi:hypothetical protein
MHAGGGENETDGDIAVDRVQMRLVAIVGFDHRLVDLLRPTVAGEGVERAREGRLGGYLAERLPAAQPAQGRTMASIRSRVVAKSHTALAMYALHSARRSWGGQPLPHQRYAAT